MRKNSTLKEIVKALNSLVSQDDIIELKLKSRLKPVLARKGYEISFDGLPSSTLPNLTKLIKVPWQALARYVMVYARDEVSEKKIFLLPLDLKISIVKSRTIFGGCNISPENYDHETNSIKKNILIGSTKQQNYWV